MKINNLFVGLATVGIIGGFIPGTPVHASTISSFKLKLHLVDKATGKQIHNDVVVDANRDFDGWYYFSVPKIDGYIPESGLYIRSVPGPTSDTTFSNSNVQPESTIEYDTYETSLSKDAVPPDTSHWSQSENTWYYVNSAGTYTRGWKEVDGKWYFLDKTTGAMKTGWIEDSGIWYYMWSDGSMATNTTIDGYYLNENGAWVQNRNNINTTYNQNSNSQVINFVDKNFEQVIRNKIGKPTGDLYKSDVEKITNLNALDKNIKDISGIENLVNLKTLQLPKNQIKDISSLKGLTNLKDLYLGSNQIKDISVLKELTNLQNIELSGNQISDISALKELTNLYSISIIANRIKDISALEGLTNLKYVGLAGNKIVDISALKKLTNLYSLYLYHNQIKDISVLEGLTNLQEIYLNDNQINDIDIESLKAALPKCRIIK